MCTYSIFKQHLKSCFFTTAWTLAFHNKPFTVLHRGRSKRSRRFGDSGVYKYKLCVLEVSWRIFSGYKEAHCGILLWQAWTSVTRAQTIDQTQEVTATKTCYIFVCLFNASLVFNCPRCKHATRHKCYLPFNTRLWLLWLWLQLLPYIFLLFNNYSSKAKRILLNNPRDEVEGNYSIIFTSPSANNCFNRTTHQLSSYVVNSVNEESIAHFLLQLSW